MSTERLNQVIEKILSRADAVRGRGEEATKQAMILPMIEALGYDIWNPSEVCPEFEADTSIKKAGQKEKVDFAIFYNNQPKIFIEVKSIDENLDGHHGQLKRYFTATTSVSLGILTNGIEYRFFTDTGEINIQDDEPFFVANLESIDQGLDVLEKFQKEVFSGEAIREFATELTYTEKMYLLMKEELDVRGNDLSDEFVRWILSSPNIYDGRITSNVVDRMKPIAKKALQRVIKNIVRRSIAAIDDGVKHSITVELDEPICDQEIDGEKKGKINVDDISESSLRKSTSTTEAELDSFAIIKKQFDNSSLYAREIYNPASRRDVPIEIGYKKTSAYFNIYFNKPSWWNLRLSLESKIKWIGIDIDIELGKKLLPSNFELLSPQGGAQFRVKIESIEDVNSLHQLIHASFEKTINDREIRRNEKQT